jgi:NAD(P)-dependent dehydrogenase (short-subunit alcohol dehydrogenase family)
MLVKDKVAVIFGGSGAIGSAVAHAMAREGARVYLGARDRKKLERVADEIRAAGGRAETFVVDVLDERSTGERIAQLTQQSGGLDIVINATGFVHNQGKEITTLSLAEFMGHHPVPGGPVQPGESRYPPIWAALARAPLSPSWLRRQQWPCRATWAISSVVRVAKPLSKRSPATGTENIRVLGVRSHAITGAVEAGSYTAEVFAAKAQAMGLTVEQWVGGAAHSTMLKRLPTLAQVADVITFLASDRADAMTATMVNMTAGATTGG